MKRLPNLSNPSKFQGSIKRDNVYSDKSSQSRNKPTSLQEVRSFEKPNSSILLAYREYRKAVHKETSRLKLQKGVGNKFEVNMRTNRKLLASDPTSFKNIPEGITDVDQNYFKIIQVRSPHKTKSFNKHRYLTDINNSLKQNIITGYFYDEMFKIDEQSETEKIKLTKIKDNFSKLSGYFELFLNDDHKESMNIMAASLRETNETEKRRAILRKKQERLGKIRNEIFGFEEIYERTLSCAAFIISITPEDFYQIGEKQKEEYVENTSRISSTSTLSLDELENQLDEVKKLKPKLYFKEPRDIQQLLRDIEVQNLKFMLHTFEFKTKIQEQVGLINLLKNFSDSELRSIRYKVKVTEKAIAQIEMETKDLEERCRKLLDQEYKEFISGNESILIHAYIAETYSYLMNAEPDEDTEANLAEIGEEYRKLLFQANSVPSKTLNNVLGSVVRTNKEKKIKARMAERKLIDFDILIAKTLKLLDKPVLLKRRKLMTRSPVTIKPKPKPKPPPPVSEEELLNLYLFTDVCNHSNPAAEIDSDEGDEEQLH